MLCLVISVMGAVLDGGSVVWVFGLGAPIVSPLGTLFFIYTGRQELSMRSGEGPREWWPTAILLSFIGGVVILGGWVVLLIFALAHSGDGP